MIALLAAVLMPATAALAHVVVTPTTAPANTSTTFEMRVPTEEAVPTIKIELLVPDDVTITGVEPVAGWRFKLEKAGDRITSVTARGKLPPEFFQRFVFRARMPATAGGVVTWKVLQTYKGGQVVRWTGDPGDEEASQTTVTPPAP